MFDPNELNSKFEDAAVSLLDAREELYKASEAVILAAENLSNAKTAAMTSGRIDGKNDEARKAQYQELCAKEFDILRDAEARERKVRFHFDQAQTRLELARYQLRIAELAK